MQWKWLGLILIPSLLSGCLATKGIARLVAERVNPFEARPPCPDTGDKQAIPSREECFSKVEVIKLTNEGVATGKIPYATIKEMKIHREGDSEGEKSARDNFDPNSYGENYRDFEVANANDLKNDLMKHNNKLVAYFVLHVGDEKLTYIPEADVCAEKERLIRLHAEEGGYGKYDIPSRYIQECSNLATIWERSTTQRQITQ